MKKILVVLGMLLASSLFAVDKLKVGDPVAAWSTRYNIYLDGSFTEICPVNENVCKVVIDGRIVEYLRIGDWLDHKEGKDRHYVTYIIKSFDYNVIQLEKKADSQ